MSITTPETENQFKMYGSALEVKSAAKASLDMLKEASRFDRNMEPILYVELESAIGQIQHLLDSATEVVAQLRPIKIEDRGYSPKDRGLEGFIKKCDCSGDCSGCGGGGTCGGTCGGGQTP